MQSYKMSFEGQLLQRGFWLYVWTIRGEYSRHVYVGRTGDTSSANASSPFRRIGQHLDTKSNAKGNALAKRLKERDVDSERCTFEMIAIGPIHPEQKTFDDHRPFRDVTAALETALADELRRRGYDVLGKHPAQRRPDPRLLSEVLKLLDSSFPALI